jgi:Spy/CpxP family protein refolding chaperone
MRRFQIAMLGLMLGSAATVSAQQTPQEQRGPRPDFFADALRGINLSAGQQQQIEALRQQYGPGDRGMRRGERGDSARVRGDRRPEGGRFERGDSMRGQRGQRPEGRRERGDTAQMRQNREEGRARMEARREQMVTSVRAILTPTQRQQFDQNLQQMQQRFQGDRRPRGNTLRSR